jgi:hypothetical protein
MWSPRVCLIAISLKFLHWLGWNFVLVLYVFIVGFSSQQTNSIRCLRNHNPWKYSRIGHLKNPHRLQLFDSMRTRKYPITFNELDCCGQIWYILSDHGTTTYLQSLMYAPRKVTNLHRAPHTRKHQRGNVIEQNTLSLPVLVNTCRLPPNCKFTLMAKTQS